MEHLYGGTFRGRRVLLTGHTGFKGSWLSLWLVRMGAVVTGLSLDDAGPESHITLTDPDITRLAVDIRDKAAVVEAVADAQPELVIHMAAQSLVRASYADITTTYATNVMGTLNVLEAARLGGTARAMVTVTTDKVYENVEADVAYVETDPLGGHDPYSSSKACAEVLASSYRRSFLHDGRLLMATVRAGNVIGGGDWCEDRLIPDIARAARAQATVEIRSPGATRPWQHVMDPLSGYLLLAQRLLEGDASCATAYNFGPDRAGCLPVAAVIERMQARWPAVSWTDVSGGEHPHEATLLMLDSGRAHRELGWAPTWDVDTALDRTARWYRDFAERDAVTTQDDIDAYVADARDAGQPWS